MDWKSTLKAEFNFDHFRPGQKEILELLSEKKSVLGLMPTGSGKSLTYQFFAKCLLPYVQADLVLVVTPLIALMEDQAEKARSFGLDTGFIHSQIPSQEKPKRLERLEKGSYRLFFATPERLQKPEFKIALAKRKVGLFVVDEAHCISLWGHDFRPDYAKLGEVQKSLGEPVTLALTATATPDVQKEILKSLTLNAEQVVSTGLRRDNIGISVKEIYGLEEKLEDLVPRLKNLEGTILIYTTLIRTAEEVRNLLKKKGIESLIYHGDLHPPKRRVALKNFMRDENAIMVATPAFGLGIDKPNIRAVYHLEPPGSIESYFQEIGRAGRDEKLSSAVLYYDQEDLTIPMQFIQSAHPDQSYIEKMYHLIEKNPDKVKSLGKEFLAEQISFKNRHDHRVGAALNILERWGCISQVQETIQIEAPLKSEFFALENQQQLLKHHNQKLYSFLQWIKNKEDCRMLKIYEYFGHVGDGPCGLCDNCQTNKSI
jgi:ATP-dependent DNA helicase RecQ